MPKAIAIRQIDGKPGKVYYPLDLKEVPKPTPKPNELLVKIHCAALNHRDLFLRQHLYPGIKFGVPLLADGSGRVVSCGSSASKSWEGKRVILTPGTGWKDDPDGPENKSGYMILGGTKTLPNGTLQEYICVPEDEVEEAPAHLSDAEAAALPLTGLTAWRATVVKCGEKNLGPGKNVLVTGIGGGVALMALAFAVGTGANVYVTSGSEEKLKKAMELGAKGGVIYKEQGWDKKLLGKLPAERKLFDAVVDGAGGDSIEKSAKLLKQGGVISIYGMTVSPKMPFIMPVVLKNIEVKGSTMGSRVEFKDMVKFINDRKTRPVVSRVVKGIENLDGINSLFEDMKNGSQFGKLVIEVAKDGGDSKL